MNCHVTLSGLADCLMLPESSATACQRLTKIMCWSYLAADVVFWRSVCAVVIQVAERIGTRDVTCVAFAPPPVVTHRLAVGCSAFVQSVVHRHDVVPRASLASFERLRQEMLATRWEDRMQSEVCCALCTGHQLVHMWISSRL